MRWSGRRGRWDRSGDGFAVIDFETTGFAARKADRVVEIGVVCLDHSGEVVEEWTTLVNPGRDVSARHVHGITARDVYGAPRFDEVAGLLAESLRGRILAAHNLSFEAQFLVGEFGRLGHELQLRTAGPGNLHHDAGEHLHPALAAQPAGLL